MANGPTLRPRGVVDCPTPKWKVKYICFSEEEPGCVSRTIVAVQINVAAQPSASVTNITTAYYEICSTKVLWIFAQLYYLYSLNGGNYISSVEKEGLIMDYSVFVKKVRRGSVWRWTCLDHLGQSSTVTITWIRHLHFTAAVTLSGLRQHHLQNSVVAPPASTYTTRTTASTDGLSVNTIL